MSATYISFIFLKIKSNKIHPKRLLHDPKLSGPIRNREYNPVKVSMGSSTSRVDGQWFDKFIHLHRGKTQAQKPANRIYCQS